MNDDHSIWTYIFMLMFVACVNFFWKDQQNKRTYKNLYQDKVEKYDSLVVQEIDSLLVTFKK